MFLFLNPESEDLGFFIYVTAKENAETTAALILLSLGFFQKHNMFYNVIK